MKKIIRLTFLFLFPVLLFSMNKNILLYEQSLNKNGKIINSKDVYLNMGYGIKVNYKKVTENSAKIKGVVQSAVGSISFSLKLSFDENLNFKEVVGKYGDFKNKTNKFKCSVLDNNNDYFEVFCSGKKSITFIKTSEKPLIYNLIGERFVGKIKLDINNNIIKDVDVYIESKRGDVVIL